MSKEKISQEQYIKIIIKLCVRRKSLLPKDGINKQILLKSIHSYFEDKTSMDEKQVNDKIKVWIDEVSNIESVDHVTLRRALVDYGYYIEMIMEVIM